MSTIDITALGNHRYDVQITDDQNRTSHRVRVPPEILEGSGVGDDDEEAVVRESFVFLLEREPATSIMSEFSLSVISQYFPDYDEELPVRLSRRGTPPPA